MGGGPSPEQRQAAASAQSNSDAQARIAGQQFDFQKAQQEKVNPFYTQRMNQGDPNFNYNMDSAGGRTAAAFAPARAALIRSVGSQPGLPSGFREGALNDFNENQAQAFDQNIAATLAQNEQAKQAGAGGLIGQAGLYNPAAYFQGAGQGYNSIMQAPLQRPGMAGVLGGVAGGLASAIPF